MHPLVGPWGVPQIANIAPRPPRTGCERWSTKCTITGDRSLGPLDF